METVTWGLCHSPTDLIKHSSEHAGLLVEQSHLVICNSLACPDLALYLYLANKIVKEQDVKHFLHKGSTGNVTIYLTASEKLHDFLGNNIL